MSDVGYMESNPHGDGKNLTWDDLRKVDRDGRCEAAHHPDPLDPMGDRCDCRVRPLTPAERDSLGRAWLREKLGATGNLRRVVWYLTHPGDRTQGQQTADIVVAVEYLRAVLDALNGGQDV